MKMAISTAKRVRTETKIAENAVSISFAAVELAKKIFINLSGKSFMLAGPETWLNLPPAILSVTG